MKRCTEEQVAVFKRFFLENPYPSQEEASELAKEAGLENDTKKVQAWFKRQRNKIREEYLNSGLSSLQKVLKAKNKEIRHRKTAVEVSISGTFDAQKMRSDLQELRKAYTKTVEDIRRLTAAIKRRHQELAQHLNPSNSHGGNPVA